MMRQHGGAVRRIVPLTFGWVDLPETVSIHGGDPAARLRQPVPGVLLQVDGGWLLLDTGFNVALLRDPRLYARFHGRNHDDRVARLPGERESLEVAFELVGIDPGEVTAVAVSHLHYDHAGGLRYFAGRLPVHCQRRELAYGLHRQPEAEGQGIFRFDFDDPTIDWRLADGLRRLKAIAGERGFAVIPGHHPVVWPSFTQALGVPGPRFGARAKAPAKAPPGRPSPKARAGAREP